MADMTNHLAAIRTLRKEYRARELAIRQHKDDNLSAQGLAVEKASRLEKLRAEGATALARINADVTTEREWLQNRAEQAMPKATSSTADAWARVRMLLDAGRKFSGIVKTADIETLQAIREWGPTYLEAQRSPESLGESLDGGRAPVDIAPLKTSIAQRWAELSDKDGIIQRHHNAQGPIAAYDVLASDTDNLLRGFPSNELEVALGAELAGQAAGTGLPATEDTSEQVEPTRSPLESATHAHYADGGNTPSGDAA